MNRRFPSLLMLSMLLTTAKGQTSSSDSQTLQVLLQEVRELRQELKSSAVAIQRAQILLYRLQIQSVVVGKASQRVDEARLRLGAIQARHRELNVQIKKLDEKATEGTTPAEQKDTANLMEKLKAELEVLLTSEQERQAVEIDSEGQLRIEEAKLREFQEELDQIDKVLKGLNIR